MFGEAGVQKAQVSDSRLQVERFEISLDQPQSQQSQPGRPVQTKVHLEAEQIRQIVQLHSLNKRVAVKKDKRTLVGPRLVESDQTVRRILLVFEIALVSRQK